MGSRWAAAWRELCGHGGLVCPFLAQGPPLPFRQLVGNHTSALFFDVLVPAFLFGEELGLVVVVGGLIAELFWEVRFVCWVEFFLFVILLHVGISGRKFEVVYASWWELCV